MIRCIVRGKTDRNDSAGILGTTLFWTAADLEQKLLLFQDYFNKHRVHSSLKRKLFNFRHPESTAIGQAIWFSIISFIASSAASSAYLTVSEIFPLEIRAFAISVFYAAGTLTGGVGAPLLFGHLIQTGSRGAVFKGYLAGALFMLVGAAAEALFESMPRGARWSRSLHPCKRHANQDRSPRPDCYPSPTRRRRSANRGSVRKGSK